MAKTPYTLFNFPRATKVPVEKELSRKSNIRAAVITLITAFLFFYFALVPLNLRSEGFWASLTVLLFVFFAAKYLVLRARTTGWESNYVSQHVTWRIYCRKKAKLMLIPFGFALLFALILFTGSELFNAQRYAGILTVENAVFAEDLAPSLSTDSIALMDTDSARMLGDREIGALSDVVSQYDVSSYYTQIDLNGKPKKVAPLGYAGFFKWINNKENGVPGYVIVDPVSMSASYESCEDGMIYVPSAFFGQYANRYIRMHNLTKMFGNLHFEVNEEGRPYYVASVYQKTISLFSGKIVSGVIVLDPATGELSEYPISDVPQWIDISVDGDLLCKWYNWYGTLKNGFWNSVFAKKDCKQVTTYYVSEDEGEGDFAPMSDYGYVAKDGDIWIYTGITSVNGDSSNIGFFLANERTGEAHYYAAAGADEKSAMAAAEGEVQEKHYQASFPALINVDGCPTYIMVLKDAGGLVKLYAAVNVEQYNLVTTASTQAECLNKYRSLLGIKVEPDPTTEETGGEEKTFVIADIKFIDIDGNTYIYLISGDQEIYKAKAAEHEDMLLLNPGDTVRVLHINGRITSFELLAANAGE